ncbi:protein PALS1 isoform X2 [Anabrus simplex]|uniref:protein PALS1 isoform X2 n=1 Tax=Anabrus simplex TaxID=316456 RepID=UPI0035A2F1AF
MEENSLTVMESKDIRRVKDSNMSLDKVVDNPFEDNWLVSPFSFDYKFLDSPSQFNKFESQAVSDSAALLQAIHALADGVEDLSFCGTTSANDSNSSREDSALYKNMGRFLDTPTPLDRENEKESRIDDMTLYRGANTSAKNKEGVQEASKSALDLAQNSNVQDAFVIAVEQQARERLERLSALKRIKPVDMTKLSQQQIPATEQQQELNGFIESSPIYVTSIPPSSTEPPPTARRRGGAGVAVKVTPGAGAGGTSTTNGHASSVEEPDSAAEIELKQELEEEEPPVEPLPSGSPFANGRTEVLIGQDEAAGRLRTTAIVETSDERPRRRSGSNIVVVEAGGAQDKPVPDDDMMMMTLDNGPHREMAVDVPDSFIARSKTPPRYPPPRPQTRLPTTTTSPPGLNGSVTAPKPVPPPRDHLRIERDGRLVNRAPAPQVPARTVINNNNNNNTEREPTKEQLDSIRKFQEALRKRKEEEERVAQQNEFLNRSLRGSRKLQALESHPPPTGVINDGYSSADEEQQRHRETLRTVIGYGELVASLQRLQLQLKKSSLGQGGYSSLEGQLAAVQTLLLSPQFGRALAVHNKVQQVWNGRVPPPASSHAQNLVRDCLDALQPCSLADAAELADLLTRYEIEGLLHAHDAIAAASAASGITMGSPLEEETPAQLPGGENIRIIKIEKTNEPLGATVRNEGDAVIIGRIVRGGAAEKSGLLHEGDEVLEVNGIEMRGKSVNEVCDILSGMTGTLTFLIVPKSAARPALPSTRDTLLHMKAHFDYDPEEDLYIPCRELGISFQKGDVLHVISQEDPNWWQAYREGEEDQTLAGLIPSRSFQHQRESMKQTIAGDKLTREKTKKAGTLLCAKKNPKKKKKKLPYNDGGYPLYATSTIDDYDADEILTYEEVALYYPRANHKRPIVLIGPSNIGRHELRQRLMEDAERFAAAIPHTSRARKEGEVDGQDYHFISRAQFESDILARKFVEHGEYEKAYYGTSLDAIRSVVNSGKICVLNLHPQSLKILRGSDLKPYVVFVAPPSLEKLRQKKIRSGEAYKEDELKDIIEKAREMEDKYDHYFDKVIVNSDTDRAYHQLLNEINALEREPQWVPASWVRAT